MFTSQVINTIVMTILAGGLGFFGWLFRKALTDIEKLKKELGEYKVDLLKNYVSKSDLNEAVQRLEKSMEKNAKDSKDGLEKFSKENRENTNIIFRKLDNLNSRSS